jgi:hypothetical protein
MWAITALLAIGAGALALWPASDRYRASAVVQVGPPNAQGLAVTTLEFDAREVTRPDTVSRVVDSVLGSDVLRAHLTTTASSRETAIRRVRDAVELVRATAAAASSHPGARADARTALDRADAAVKEKHAQSGRADGDLAEWFARTGNPDPAQQLATSTAVYDAALRNGHAADITATKKARDEASAQYDQYTKLKSKAATAHNDEVSAQDSLEVARANFDKTSSAPPTVKVSAVQEDRIAEDRPAGRLSLAAIMLVLVIAAADALFLTRVKLPLPLPLPHAPTRAPARKRERLPAFVPEPPRAPTPEPARARAPEPVSTHTPEPSIVPLPEPVLLPLPEPANAAVPNRRRYPRRRRERVAASPLDLPNIEVHLLDREGGLRSIQLRNTAGTQATKAQHQREQ